MYFPVKQARIPPVPSKVCPASQAGVVKLHGPTKIKNI
jgi:hypothetical protein